MTVTALLDNPRVGVLHLDRRGRIIEANGRARCILRQGDGLADRNGTLCARAPADQVASRAAGGRRAAGLRHGRGQWVDAAPPLARAAAVRDARQARGRPATRLRSAARCGDGADRRAGAPAACRSRPDGQDPGADTAGESGGGLVGGRQDRARHGPGDWAHGTRHLLASAADLPEAVHLAASGPWCGWCCRSPNSNERRRCRHFPGASTWRGYLRHGRTPAFLTPT